MSARFHLERRLRQERGKCVGKAVEHAWIQPETSLLDHLLTRATAQALEGARGDQSTTAPFAPGTKGRTAWRTSPGARPISDTNSRVMCA